MEFLFDRDIAGWDSWGEVFQDRAAFEKLAQRIFEIHALSYGGLGPLSPGTNAVFRAGDYVVKIFVPAQSGYDSLPDYRAECFGIAYAHAKGVRVPKLVAQGEVRDKYLFRYLIMEYIQAQEIGTVRTGLTAAQKYDLGARLRATIDALNKPCSLPYPAPDFLRNAPVDDRWGELSNALNAERIQLVRALTHEQHVYVHADITAENVLIAPDGELYLIDFADARTAPHQYEWLPLVCDACGFDPDMLQGLAGNDSMATIAQRCFEGILLHDFGAHMILSMLGTVAQCDTLEKVRSLLFARMGIML